MTDLMTLAATPLDNFATVRIPRYEPFWTEPEPDLPLEARSRSLAIAMSGEYFIARRHWQNIWLHLLETGHRAFFDRIEGCGSEGWRLHFFCLDPSALVVLHNSGVGVCGRGEARMFNAEEFVMRRLRQLERAGCIDKPEKWWRFFD